MEHKISIVKNDAMNIIGINDNGIEKFLGIPYAEPPIGNLRFAPPKEKSSWKKTLDCTKFRDSAIQSNELINSVTGVSEDCLYLNIWKPAKAKIGDKLPVYVWIHGGGWCYGSGAENRHDGTAFAKDGIILVTINYRLGALGYLALNVLLDEYGTAGNWATLDLIMALHWVNDNIAKFGGNPNNITVGGESAGSFNTFALMLSPGSKGLFQKAILESGTLTYIFENKMRLDKAIEIGKKIASHFGADDSRKGLEILRNVDPMEIWKVSELNLHDLIAGSLYQTYPIYDGVVLPLNEPYQALVNGIYNKDVKVLIGNNRFEGPSFINTDTLTLESFNEFIRKSFRPDIYKEVTYFYANQTKRSLKEKADELMGMAFITLGVAEVENRMTKAGVPLYAYEFNYTDSKGNLPRHAKEINYAFGQQAGNGFMFTGNDLIVRDTIHEYWVNFIKTGNPNGDGLLEWPIYVEGTKSIMEFRKTPQLINRSNQDLIDFLTPRYFR